MNFHMKDSLNKAKDMDMEYAERTAKNLEDFGKMISW